LPSYVQLNNSATQQINKSTNQQLNNSTTQQLNNSTTQQLNNIILQVKIKIHGGIGEGYKQYSPACFIIFQVYHIVSEADEISKEGQQFTGRGFQYICVVRNGTPLVQDEHNDAVK
jgi:hypothetical protein